MKLIDPFPNHPFYVFDDEEMYDLTESIWKYGLITPIIVRRKQERFELISGHRRVHACRNLGHSEIACHIIEASDDNDYYLRRLTNGTYNTAGSLFADYRCSEIGETNNYIIYGHNMKNGTMFSSLTKYKSQSYYDEHPVLYLYTPEGNYKIELIAGFVSKPTGEVYNTVLTYEQMLEFCSHSTFRSTITPCDVERYIMLSTCSYEHENARYVVIGKLNMISE